MSPSVLTDAAGFAPPRRGKWSIALLGLWLASLTTSAWAQSRPTETSPISERQPKAVLFSTASAKGGTGPLDSVLHAALEELNVVTVVGRPGMDLNAVQLAIDCVSETPSCLRAVAAQTGAEVLIAPSLQSTPTELVLSVLRFDTTDGELRRVVRRQSGGTLRSETLDGVPAMLRELFGLPEPAQEPAVATAPAAEETPETEPPPLIEPPQEPTERSMPVGPWILAGAGVLAIGSGAVMGALMLGNQNDFNDAPEPRNEQEVNDLLELQDTGETQGVAATILFGVGAASVIAGGIWLAVELSQPATAETDWETAVVPTVGPGQLGLSFIHRGGAQ